MELVVVTTDVDWLTESGKGVVEPLTTGVDDEPEVEFKPEMAVERVDCGGDVVDDTFM